MIQEMALLGSTGSIGRQSLEVAESLGIRITALCANNNIRELETQARKFLPRLVVVFQEKAAKELQLALADTSVRVLGGAEGLIEAALSAKCVLQSMSGTCGILPTLEALKAGARVCLANKETLVCAGDIVMKTAADNHAELLPVDSEHSAIFQCLNGAGREMKRILLTASGGPFRGKKRSALAKMTAQDALKHPTWNMGAKITIDSATLMNKGLEFIEAMHLFNATPEQITVLVHPQSIVHSMVEFCDGAILAQMGAPDMRLPIQYAVTWPERKTCIAQPLDLTELSNLTFEAPDLENFPLLGLAIEAAKRGGMVPAVMNGANEAAVALFLQGKTDWFGLEQLVFEAVEQMPFEKEPSLEEILEAQVWARDFVLTKGKACIS